MDNGESSYRRYLDGDDTGIVEIIRDYKDGLTLYINGYTKNIFAAEEIMEETFFRLAVRKPRFSGRSSFKTWLYTIAGNAAIDYLRKESKMAPLSEVFPDAFLAEEQSIENDYLKKEQSIILLGAMKKLKSEYFQVLYLTYFEGFSGSETAKIMKKSRRQIENLIYRAKNSLKNQLEKEGFEYEEL